MEASTGYTPDPHGAVGYLGLKSFLGDRKANGIFLETAHPAKFKDVVEGAVGHEISLPKPLEDALHKEKKAIAIGNQPQDLKAYLLG